MKKNEIILELNKIIDKLKEEMVLSTNKDIEEYYSSCDIDEVNTMLDETDNATKIIQRMGRIPLYFESDVSYLLMKTTKQGVLTIDEILEVGKFLDSIKAIMVYNESLKSLEIENEVVEKYSTFLVYPKDLNLRIRKSFNGFGEVLDEASANIAFIRNSIKDTMKNLQQKLQEIVNKNASKLTQSIISIRNDRYVIPVKNDFKNVIKGIIHDESASGETVFIEPIIVCELNNKLNSLKEEEKKEIFRILKDISLEISNHNEELQEDYRIIEKLDMIFGKASLSIKLNGNRPKVNEQGIVSMLNCYHPLLNVSNIVTNNIIIGKEYQGIIITGPNTGGKTVLLKTIGLLSLMIKIGLLVPCSSESNLAIFDDVFADIGDEQSIDQNLSTFSSHQKNVIEILNNCNNNSLVLLDELGSGTDPQEGAALAISIFDYLLEKKCLVIASSHYAELKVHAFESPNIINASVEFNTETLRPTYKLLIGVPGESNALKISKILGLPDEIIDRATHYAYNNNNEVSLVLEKLSNQSHMLERKLNEIRDKEYRLNQRLQEINKQKENINNSKQKILDDAEVKANEIISKTMKKVDALLDELQSMKLKEVKAHEIASIKHDIKELKENSHVESDYIPVDHNREIVVLDNVFVKQYNASGVVTKINKNRYEVQIGNASITCKKEDLQLTQKEVYQQLIKTTTTFSPKKTVKMTLDLRGMRYEDAEPLIDDYLYDAFFANLHQVSIVHGFGTGVIRELVQNKVKKNRNVESFRYGGQNEGGQGATIVTLKEK